MFSSLSSNNYHMNSSEGGSLSGRQPLNNNYHALPPISQPILLKYRMPRPLDQLVVEESTSLWCTIFGKPEGQALSLCKCERTEDGYCELVMRWISEYYDWKADPRFIKTYRNYTKRSIELFLTEGQIHNRLGKKLEILGVKLGEAHLNMLARICRNYLKHTIYYNKSELLTRQNDLWMWFAIGIFYHIGASSSQQGTSDRHEEQIIFWGLDIVMNKFQNLTRGVICQQVRKTLELIRDYFPKNHSQLVNQYHIDLEPIVYEWTNEMMMGYMGVDSIAFFIDCLLKRGWSFFHKVALSYFEKRMQKMEHDELFESVQDKQVITRELMNCSEEWPLIFCNAGTFGFDKEKVS